MEDESARFNLELSWNNDLVSFYGPVPQSNETIGSFSEVGILYKLNECHEGARNYDMICSADQIATSLAGHRTQIMENDEVILDFAAISECYYFNPTILISHDYSGPEHDISAEMILTDHVSRLKIKDNGVSINQAVKFSIVASPDLSLSEQSN